MKFVVILGISIAIITAIPLWRLFIGPPEYILPNLLLFTGFRKTAQDLWHKYVKIDSLITYDHEHIPVIEVADYTFERLRTATQNFRYPAIIRGIFKDSPATVKWRTANYLPSRIGHHRIPVINSLYGNRTNNTFRSFDEVFTELHGNSDSKTYLFFPLKSKYNSSDKESLDALQRDVNKLVLDDLEVDRRIWTGFGTSQHKTYFGSQIIIGQGASTFEQSTGTGWHCAAGNNWFAQAVGRKRWYFLDAEYSPYMYPLRWGRYNMMTGHSDMEKLQFHIPMKYCDLEEGDLLYNPDWEWHAIKNYEGLSIGVPMREVNMSLIVQNHLHYAMIIPVNRLLEKVGLDVGGYPPLK